MTKTQISLPLLTLTSALALTGCVTPGGTISTGSAPTAAQGETAPSRPAPAPTAAPPAPTRQAGAPKFP